MARIRADGGQAEALTAEIGELEGVQRMVARAVEAWGKLNIVTVKPAVIGLIRQIAAEYGQSGIGSNAICRAGRGGNPW